METGEPVKSFFIKTNKGQFGFSYYEKSQTIRWNAYQGEFRVASSPDDPLYSQGGQAYQKACEKVWSYMKFKNPDPVPSEFLPGEDTDNAHVKDSWKKHMKKGTLS